MSDRIQECLTVLRDGEELRVWNKLNVDLKYTASGGNPLTEEFPNEHVIRMGGGGPKPDHITSWVAETLRDEFGIEKIEERYGIEVVDMESGEVEIR